MDSNNNEVKASNDTNKEDTKNVSFSLPDTKTATPRVHNKSTKPTYAGILKGEK